MAIEKDYLSSVLDPKFKNYILKKERWALSIPASQAVRDSWVLHQEGKPFFKFKSALEKPFAIEDVEQVITFHESIATDTDGDTCFQTILKLKDKRYVHTVAYLNEQNNHWKDSHGGIEIAWDLKTLINSLYPEDLRELKLECFKVN
jgi:hypothetical protein